jgi:hypothetical protein
MFVFPDLSILDIVNAGFAQLQRDPTPIADLLKTRPDEQVVDFSRFMNQTLIEAKLGYPRQHPELPGVYITIGTSSEEQQTIGGDFPLDEVESDDAEFAYVTGTHLRTSVRISCMDSNALRVVYIAAVVEWLLLGRRLRLNKAGLIEQNLSVADLVVAQELLPDLAFRRDITLSALHPATATGIETGITIEDISVVPTVEPYTPQQPNGIAVIRNTATRRAPTG